MPDSASKTRRKSPEPCSEVVDTKDIYIPPIKRIWAKCPHCERKAVLFHDRANCNGVFVKCKSCGQEFELVVYDGKQVTKV